ncbi:MAG TPA: hypothetical protein VF794_14120 [Archangium sp.]|jgi:hypothetical protein|uniref:hypothetical protein n=1 Tax=Archangium sp. TaxID=1872627 RepID=UPI002ED92239
MALLEGLRGDFDEHDAFLHLLLGLVSLSRRFEPLLPPPADGAPVPPAEAPHEGDERLVSLLLGLVSVRRTVMGTLEPLRAAHTPPASTDVSEARARSPLPRDLLR